MKKLIIVNTYYQLLIAMQLTRTVLHNIDLDLILVNSSKRFEEISNKIKKDTDFFCEIYFVEKEFLVNSRTTLLKKIRYRLLYSRINQRKYIDFSLDFSSYDEIFFLNKSDFLLHILLMVRKEVPHIKVSRFEEGFICYTESPSVKEILLNKAKTYNYIDKMTSNYYFYEPSQVSDYLINRYTIKEIPKLSRNDQDFIDTITNVFELKEVSQKYPQKYIFFEQCFLEDGLAVDDFSLIVEIGKIVGKENLLIKMHPRSKTDRFAKHGYHTMFAEGNLPWEVVMLQHDFSNHVFITVNSGSVISPFIIFEEKIKTFYLGLLFNNQFSWILKERCEVFDSRVESLSEAIGGHVLSVPKTKEEFFKELKEYHRTIL